MDTSIDRAARELEGILSRTLFRPAAEFARRARLAVHELESAIEEIEASQGRNRSRIALGLLPLAGVFVVARALKDFTAKISAKPV